MRYLKLTTITAVISAFIAAALVAAPANAGKRFEGVTLTVGTFGGSWKDRINGYVGKKFAEEGG